MPAMEALVVAARLATITACPAGVLVEQTTITTVGPAAPTSDGGDPRIRVPAVERTLIAGRHTLTAPQVGPPSQLHGHADDPSPEGGGGRL